MEREPPTVVVREWSCGFSTPKNGGALPPFVTRSRLLTPSNGQCRPLPNRKGARFCEQQVSAFTGPALAENCCITTQKPTIFEARVLEKRRDKSATLTRS